MKSIQTINTMNDLNYCHQMIGKQKEREMQERRNDKSFYPSSKQSEVEILNWAIGKLFSHETGIELEDYIQEFNLQCYDGVAIGDNKVARVVMIYPILSDATEVQKKEAVHYRTSSYDNWEECSNGDLMVRYGKVIYSETLNIK